MGTVITSFDLEHGFIASAQAETGRSLEEWLGLVGVLACEDRMTLIQVLKTQHGLNHVQAQLIAGIFLNGGEPVYKDSATKP
jgi:hypothetical protein